MLLTVGEEDAERARRFKQAHKAARRQWALPESFPNHVVVNAYIRAKVDASRDKYAFWSLCVAAHDALQGLKWQWALPDSFINHVAVNAYIRAKVDASRDKCASQCQRVAPHETLAVALPDSFPNHVIVNAYIRAKMDASWDKCAPHGNMAHLLMFRECQVLRRVMLTCVLQHTVLLRWPRPVS